MNKRRKYEFKSDDELPHLKHYKKGEKFTNIRAYDSEIHQKNHELISGKQIHRLPTHRGK